MDGGSGSRLYNTSRVGYQSMSFANSMYSQDNKVSSVSADLNSRFSDKISNQLLFTYTDIEDMRGTNSSPFPFIDILAGKDAEGNQIMEPYMSAGYELFTYNNGVKNKITSVIDNFTTLPATIRSQLVSVSSTNLLAMLICATARDIIVTAA